MGRALAELNKRRSFRHLAVLAAVGSAVGLAGPMAHGQCQYDVTVLEYPIGCAFGTVFTVGVGWNEQGAIVGYYQCPIWKHTEAFLWTPEDRFITLPRPPGISSNFAKDINNAGTIVGIYTGTDFQFRGYVYEDGEYTELEPLPGGAWSQAIAINDAGQVTGYRSIGSKDDPVFPYNAFVWSRDEGFIDLGVMSGPASSGSAINNAGVVVGWTGTGTTTSDTFVWQDRSLSFLGPVPGGCTSTPYGLGAGGEIVGSGQIELNGFPIGASRAFVWQSGQFTLLGTLRDHMLSRARDISSETRQIVGRSWYVDGNPNIDHGFIWQHGAIIDLNSLVSPDLTVEIEAGSEVADNGRILAFGDQAALILTPIDPPLGDLDVDCRVGIVDFLKLLADWGACPEDTDCRADLNGDGVVDGLDFAILLMNWGE